MRGLARGLLLLALAPAGCGVNAFLDESVPPPRVIAILPLEGTLPWGERELVRSMLREQLRPLHVTVLDNLYVDRALSERGWMDDPELFRIDRVDLGECCSMLGVEGLVIGRSFDAAELDVGVAYRSALSGTLEWVRGDGRRFWRVEHSEASSGGPALASGQIITALRDQFGHGTPMAFVARIDAWLSTVLQTLPELPLEGFQPTPPPRIDEIVRALSLPSRGGEGFAPDDRIVVEVRASSRAIVEFDLLPTIQGVPMVEIGDGLFRGEYRVTRNDGVQRPEIRVRARDRLGRVITRAGWYLITKSGIFAGSEFALAPRAAGRER